MLGISIRTSDPNPEFWAVVDKAASFETRPSLRELGYPAHITFAAYRDVKSAVLREALSVFDHERIFTARFEALATFDAASPVIWLKPNADGRLYAIHDRIHALVDEDRCEPYYRPGNWIPHCTVAVAIDPAQRQAALSFARRPLSRFSISFDVAEVISWPPPKPLASIELRR
ncbi:MAG: 2'-5' RNA ligase family protein [Pseudomonadota bacterium]|nr:2'-5' RNA ligase family protein [Pseudomonadota bacterium]